MKRLFFALCVLRSTLPCSMSIDSSTDTDFAEKYVYLKKMEKTIYSDLLQGEKIERTKDSWDLIRRVAHAYTTDDYTYTTRRRACRFLGKAYIALGVLTSDHNERQAFFSVGKQAFLCEARLASQNEKLTNLSNYPLPGTISSE